MEIHRKGGPWGSQQIRAFRRTSPNVMVPTRGLLPGSFHWLHCVCLWLRNTSAMETCPKGADQSKAKLVLRTFLGSQLVSDHHMQLPASTEPWYSFLEMLRGTSPFINFGSPGAPPNEMNACFAHRGETSGRMRAEVLRPMLEHEDRCSRAGHGSLQ